MRSMDGRLLLFQLNFIYMYIVCLKSAHPARIIWCHDTWSCRLQYFSVCSALVLFRWGCMPQVFGVGAWTCKHFFLTPLPRPPPPPNTLPPPLHWSNITTPAFFHVPLVMCNFMSVSMYVCVGRRCMCGTRNVLICSDDRRRRGAQGQGCWRWSCCEGDGAKWGRGLHGREGFHGRQRSTGHV